MHKIHTGHSSDRRKLGTRMHPGRVSFWLCVEQNELKAMILCLF